MATRKSNYADPNYWGLDALQAPVFTTDIPVLAIAGPGSGKTRTIIAKAVRLIQENGTDLSSVALVTFTKAAALEMQTRLRKALPSTFENRRGPCFIGTFHGLSYQLLQKHWKSIGVKRKILSDQEIFDLIIQSAKEVNCALKFDQLRSGIERFKSYPVDYSLRDEDLNSEEYKVFSIYEKRRIANNACDVNDMVRECLAGIRTGTIAPLPVKFLLADEMQDADLVQIDWILAHYSNGTIPTLVADDDQSIYAFRNAAGFRGLKMFCESTGAKILPMTYNYRSCTSIVGVSNLIISDTPDRFEKKIEARRDEEGSVSFAMHVGNGSPKLSGDTVQAKTIVTEAKEWLDTHPRSSAAVLARTNNELDPIELACKTLGIPYIRMGGSDFLKRPHISRAISALMLPSHPNDNLAYSTACLVNENFAKPAKDAIIEFFHQSDGSTHVLDLASNPRLLTGMRRDDQTAFRTFRGWISDWFDIAEGTEAELSKGISTLLGRLANQCTDSGVSKDLLFLGVMLAEWCTGSLAGRLNMISQRAPQPTDKVGAITLCSAHASKGLEFDHVSIINADTEHWPYSKDEKFFFEEKRLFYVAATRAKDHLSISFAQEENDSNQATVFVHPVLAEAARLKQLAGMRTHEAQPVADSLQEVINA